MPKRVTKVDWEMLKAEYADTKATLKEIAERYELPLRTVQYHAQNERWQAARDCQRRKKRDVFLEEAAKADAGEGATIFQKMRTAADQLVDAAAAIMADKKRISSVMAIKDMAVAMKNLTSLIRDLYDLPTVQEQSAMDIALERLRLDQAKSGVGEEDDGGGVVEIAEVIDE